MAIGDYDGDGDDDVLVANRSGLGALYRNDGDRFHETDELQSMTAAEGTTAAVFADYDNDGDLDVFLTNESGPNHLYRNEAELGFQRLTSELGLYLGERAVGAGFYDYDNDGDLDLVTTAVNPAAGGDELYQNMSSGALVPVGPLLALASSSNGRALSFADYDGDGDLDLFIADYDRSHLYRNPAVGGNWLQVDLDGQGYNRRGVGAWIWLVAGDLRLRRQVQSSFGYASQTPSRLHLGLGPAARVDSMWVLWPDGKTTLRTDVRANQIVRLTYPRRVTAILGLGETGAVAFELRPNYPNPFNAKTRIPYYVPRQTLVELAIYNIAGQQVRRLVGEVVEAGNHTVTWDGLDDTGGMVGSGVYLFRMRADRFTHTRRLAVVK